MAATTMAQLGSEKGLRLNFVIPTDDMVPRDRLSRLLSSVAICAVMVIIPADFFEYWGSFTNAYMATAGWDAGLLLGLLTFTGFFFRRMVIYNEEYAGYVTQNPYPRLLNFVEKKQDQNDGMEIYGPGPHIAHFWEQRNRKNTYSLKVTTRVIDVSVPTRTSEVTVTVAYEYADDICHLDRAIGADNETVIKGYDSYIAAFLTQQLSGEDASDAATMDKALNDALANEFMCSEDATGRRFSKFEVQFGIRTIAIVVSKIKLPKDVQTTRDAIEEAKQVHKIVAAMLGIDTDELTRRENDGRVNAKLMLELRKEALAMSKNASLSYVDVGGSSKPITVIGSDTRSVGMYH